MDLEAAPFKSSPPLPQITLSDCLTSLAACEVCLSKTARTGVTNKDRKVPSQIANRFYPAGKFGVMLPNCTCPPDSPGLLRSTRA